MLPRRLVLPIALLVCIGTTACSTAPSPTADGSTPAAPGLQASITAHPWQLVGATGATGQPVAALQDKPGQPYVLTLRDGRLGVANGCNHMGGDVRLQGDMLEFGQMMSTRMACADDRLMQADGAMGQALTGRAQLRMPDADTLHLLTANGWTLVLRRSR